MSASVLDIYEISRSEAISIDIFEQSYGTEHGSEYEERVVKKECFFRLDNSLKGIDITYCGLDAILIVS